MGKVIKISLALVVLLVLAVAGYILAIGYVSWDKDYPWSHMDWNNDGHTSVREFLESADTGVRNIEEDGKQCLEYYRYKDGLPVKKVCDEI